MLHTFNSAKKRFQRGFTLIEILVVITVIGILLAAGGAAFLNVQKSARDSERLKEVTAVQDALEQFYAANGYYAPAGTGDGLAALEGIFTTAPNNIAEYFPGGNLPEAPTGGGGLPYTFVTNAGGTPGSAYCVCTSLEQPVRANATGSDGSTGACTFVAAGQTATMFCLNNKQ